MEGNLIGSDGDMFPTRIMGPEQADHFWILADEPDAFVAGVIMSIENRLNPERSEADVRWIANVE